MEIVLFREWLMLSCGALGLYLRATWWDVQTFASTNSCLEHKKSSWTAFYLLLTLSASSQPWEMKVILEVALSLFISVTVSPGR